MKKITVVLITILIFSSILFTGCFGDTESDKIKPNPIENIPPTAVISASTNAYFGEMVEFDASGSYDPDGEIVAYSWDVGEDEFIEGKIVKYTFKFENNFTIDYPLIYSVNLFIEDNNGSVTATSHQIKIFPSAYIFYFNDQTLTVEQPDSNIDEFKGSGLFRIRDPEILDYDLTNPVKLQKCSWNATLYFEKPFFSILNKVAIVFIDKNSDEVAQMEKNLGFVIGKEIEIGIKGSFETEMELKSVKLKIYGLTLLSNVALRYGGEKASCISFDFT